MCPGLKAGQGPKSQPSDELTGDKESTLIGRQTLFEHPHRDTKDSYRKHGQWVSKWAHRGQPMLARVLGKLAGLSIISARLQSSALVGFPPTECPLPISPILIVFLFPQIHCRVPMSLEINHYSRD